MEWLTADDGQSVGVVGTMGIGEVENGMVEEGFQFLAGLCDFFLLVVEREGV